MVLTWLYWLIALCLDVVEYDDGDGVVVYVFVDGTVVDDDVVIVYYRVRLLL